ncbi:MAG TPA: general secretion pathway protein GspB [Steroidobacteraceae bacterium]|nr:general secretion pathway protein GspB [Steroidobacteraceae bacterium]
MSFILDALKKSESDRQRHSGPALFEVKVAAPRSALPLWAVAIAVLLAVNLAIVGWLLVRHPAAHSAAPGASAPPAAAAAAPGVANSAAAPAPPAAAPALVPAAAPAGGVPPAPQPAARAAPASAVAADNPGPDDTAPAVEPPSDTAFGHVKRGTGLGMPLYPQAANAPGAQLPQLRLDLHAYAERPQDRWVMINMHKLREGDALPEGVRVEHIIPEGAVVSYQGSQFLLPRD